MTRGLFIFCLSVSGLATAECDESFVRQIRPLLEERCLSCHSTAEQEGDLDLERFATVEDIRNDPSVWEQVLEQIGLGEMPPKKEPQLTPEQKELLNGWVQGTLDAIALANAGDPGPVVLRRLSNQEYTYSIRDLTGVDSLDPAEEFPVDGAAGEGFTNAGAALVMSPALLTKYLDAAKDIANHAVLTPEGIRFSPNTSTQDWTDETLAAIRAFYGRFTTSGNATSVNLQGVKFDTNAGGRLPVEDYLAALQGGGKVDGLNAKYLGILKGALTDEKPSLLLDPLRAKFREGRLTVADIEVWQQSLWRFASVGHIGKKDGPKGWQEPVDPLVARHEMRLKLTPPEEGGDLTIYLSAGDAGDEDENDIATWENARLVAPGRADLPLRELRAELRRLETGRAAVIASVTNCLAAAHEARSATGRTDVAKLAQKHGVDPALLAAWLDYLAIGTSGVVELEPLLAKKIESTPDYRFIKGWAGEQALSVMANSSDATVRTPGTMKGHGVTTHPSPTLASVIAWRSPAGAEMAIRGSLSDAHTDCGNGVTWALELRRGQTREVLASGVTQGATAIPLGPFEKIRLFEGDVIALIIGPRDGNHICDLTAVDLTLTDGKREWDLAKDVSPDILAGNPHADRHGNAAVWHFLSQPADSDAAPVIPVGSLLTRWRNTDDAVERSSLAGQVRQLLERGLDTAAADSPDRDLRDQLLSFNGPLLGPALPATAGAAEEVAQDSPFGIDPASFGKHPDGGSIGKNDLCVKAPDVIEVRLPASLIAGAEFVVTGKLHSATGGSVQMQVLTSKPEPLTGIAAGRAESAQAAGRWTDNNLRTHYSAPVIVNEGSSERQRFEAAFHEFRALFPIALCYTKIVPVDEVVTLTLYFREDDHLKRLMLDEEQAGVIDRLWDELRFVSEAPLKQVDVFDQLWQYATQDAKPEAFEPMREPIRRDAERFKERLVEVEPMQVQAVFDFAARAWRRPLAVAEQSGLTSLYQNLRQQDLSHAAAVRLLLARVLVAPDFLYRGEKASPGSGSSPVNDWELATRLSYFLWASAPDDELRALAASGKLRDPDTLAAQARRMLKSGKVGRLATEFGCQWLHVRDVAMLEEKSERHFPEFSGLRGDMQEEVARFFTDLFQNDRAVLSLLDADHTFVSPALAEYYGLAAEAGDWRRIDGLRAKGRGGILGFAATLAKHSGASRTSPILRGTWLSEVILGDKLPNPPTGVPVLPEEAPEGLTERELTERHSSDERCSSCHKRVDPFGFALEGFDAIGRGRTMDAAGLPIDTKTELPDGTKIEGLDGLRAWLLTERREEFTRQFCRKLLGYALGRGVQLSDKPLIDAMLVKLEANENKVGIVIEEIVRSPQFREVRGRDHTIN